MSNHINSVQSKLIDIIKCTSNLPDNSYSSKIIDQASRAQADLSNVRVQYLKKIEPILQEMSQTLSKGGMEIEFRDQIAKIREELLK